MHFVSVFLLDGLNYSKHNSPPFGGPLELHQGPQGVPGHHFGNHCHRLFRS